MPDRAALKDSEGVEVGVKFVTHRFDIAEKIIEIRSRHQLRLNDFGAIEFDRLNSGRSLSWSRPPNAMDVSVSLAASGVNSDK